MFRKIERKKRKWIHHEECFVGEIEYILAITSEQNRNSCLLPLIQKKIMFYLLTTRLLHHQK